MKAALKCLACGSANDAGEEWCRSCSSSLNLRLCSACEAVNASTAERCHACSAAFQAVREPTLIVHEAPPVRSFPAPRRHAARTLTPSASSTRRVVVCGALVALVAGSAYAYYRYEPRGVIAARGSIVATPAAVAAPVIAPPSAAPVVKAPPEPKPTAALVTHTRPAAAATSAPALSQAPVEKSVNPSACAPGVMALGLCTAQ